MSNQKTVAKSTSEKTVRRVNWVALSISLVGGAAIVGGAYFLRNYQVDQSAGAYWDRALALEKEGDLDKASAYIFRYTRFRPEDGQARVKLAKLFDKTPESSEKAWRAAELYYTALGHAEESEKLDLRRRLAELLLQTHQYTLAKNEAATIRNSAETPDPTAERVLAEVLYRQYITGVIAETTFDSEPIGNVIDRAHQLNPKDARIAVILAYVYRSQPKLLAEDQTEFDRSTKADSIMAKLVEENPEDPTIRLANYEYLSRYGLPGAEAELEAALKFGPDVVAVRLAAANHDRRKAESILEKGDLDFSEGGGSEGVASGEAEKLFEQARQHLLHVLEVAPNSESAFVELGDVYAAEGEVEKAKEAWNQGLSKVGEQSLSLNMRLAETLAREQNPKTKEHLERLDKGLGSLGGAVAPETKSSLSRTRDLIEALWYLQQDKPAQAIPLLQPIAAETRGLGNRYEDSLKALRLLTAAHQRLEQWEEAAVAFEAAVETAPSDWRFRLGAATMWQAAGQPERAVEHFSYVAPELDTPGAWMALARAQFETIVRQDKPKRNWQPFEVSLAKTKAAMEGKVIGEAWMVDLLQANYRLATAVDPNAGRQEALAILRQVEKDHPDDVAVCAALTSAFQRLGEEDEADKKLAKLAELTKNSNAAILKRAEILVQRSKSAEAEKVLRDGISELPLEEGAPLRRAVVQLYIASGKFDAATKELEALYLDDPDNPQPLYLLLEIALRQQDYPKAQRWESELEETEGYLSTLGRYYRICRLVATAKDQNDPRLNQAKADHSILSRDRSNWPLTHFAEGLIWEKFGNYDSAVKAYERAVHYGDRRASTVERLVRLLASQGRFFDATHHLEALSQRVPNSTDLSSLAIHVAAQLDDVNQAEKIAAQGIESRPEDPLAWLWYGQVKVARGDFEAAEKALEKATQLGPKDVRTWNGLFTYQYRKGSKEAARKTLSELSKHVELSEADLAFVRAQGYELLGDRDMAKQEYALAEKKSPENFELLMRVARFYLGEDPDRAEQSLRKALELKPGSGAAKRLLAIILAGDPTRWDEASRLLAGGNGENDELANERVQAAIFALRKSNNRVADLESAREILERVVNQAVSPAESDRLLLALVYAELSKVQESVSNRERLVELASREFKRLVTSKAQVNQTQLAVYVQFLLDQEDFDDAEQWLRALEKETPDSVLFVSLKARYLHAKGKDEEIEPLVESLVEKMMKTRSTDEEKAEAYRTIGQIYTSVELMELAEKYFNLMLGADSQRYASLAMTLARQVKYEEAVDVCLKGSENDDSSRPGIVMASILAMAANYQPPQAAETLMKDALAKFPGDENLLSAVANLYLARDDTAKATELYRKLAKKKPDDLTILNNLATLLADDPKSHNEALQLIDKAIRIAGPRAPLLDTKGTILQRAGKFEEAVAVLSVAASSPNSDPRYRFHLAVALDSAQRPTQAKKELASALEKKLEDTLLTPVDEQQLSELKKKYTL